MGASRRHFYGIFYYYNVVGGTFTDVCGIFHSWLLWNEAKEEFIDVNLFPKTLTDLKTILMNQKSFF